MAHLVLVPGMWLDGSSWEQVVPFLERAGHTTNALTLPGMDSPDADRSDISLQDHVDAVVAAVDQVAPEDGPVVVVGHSAGAGIAWAAVDARPDRVARAVFVGGFPTGDGDALADLFTVVDGEVPLPDFDDFDEADLGGLDDELRAAFRARAIPQPARVTTDPQQLSDARRHDVPVTMVCPEFTSADLQSWIDQGADPVRELDVIRHLELVDLPTGHWPQITRPDDLASVILASLPAPAWTTVSKGAHAGLWEPPVAGSEVDSLLGSLERQRITLAWKCGELDARGLRATVGVSTVTLGGLLKHLALMEDHYFTVRLLGHDLPPAWDAVDSDDPHWEWHTAADDTPDELMAMWQAAVARSRAAVVEVLADGGVDQLVRSSDWDEPPSMRRVLVDLVEEYARHVGHADIIRESVDGLTGEDPPR